MDSAFDAARKDLGLPRYFSKMAFAAQAARVAGAFTRKSRHVKDVAKAFLHTKKPPTNWAPFGRTIPEPMQAGGQFSRRFLRRPPAGGGAPLTGTPGGGAPWGLKPWYLLPAAGAGVYGASKILGGGGEEAGMLPGGEGEMYAGPQSTPTMWGPAPTGHGRWSDLYRLAQASAYHGF